MKIALKDTLHTKEWLNRSIFNAFADNFDNEDKRDLAHEIYHNAVHNQEGLIEVKLLIDGHEFEPTLLRDVLLNIEKHIDTEAQLLFIKTFEDTNYSLRHEMNALEESVKQAKEKIMEKYFTADEREYIENNY